MTRSANGSGAGLAGGIVIAGISTRPKETERADYLGILGGPPRVTIAPMRRLGRLLQLLGLVTLPISMVLELTGGLGRPFGVSDMVVMLGYGVAAFTLGWFMESYARQ